MDLVGGKWKGVILYRLMDKPKRFSELKQSITGISDRMLSLALKELELEQDRLLLKDTEARCYQLSELAEFLRPAYLAMDEWGRQYQQRCAECE